MPLILISFFLCFVLFGTAEAQNTCGDQHIVKEAQKGGTLLQTSLSHPEAASASEKKDVEVVYFLDASSGASGWYDQMSKAVNSVMSNTKQPEHLNVNVITFEKQASKGICDSFGAAAIWGICTKQFDSGAKLTVQLATPEIVGELNTFMPHNVVDFHDEGDSRLSSLANFGRLVIEQVLPKTSEIAVYLDCDTLVLGDVVEMAQDAIKRYPKSPIMLAGRPLYHQQTVESALENKTFADMHISQEIRGSTMLNAGLMVFNLPVWKSQPVRKSIVKWMHLSEANALFLGGNQAAINMALLEDGPIPTVSWQWNCDDTMKGLQPTATMQATVLAVLDQCKMLHFAGDAKPWADKTWFLYFFLGKYFQ